MSFDTLVAELEALQKSQSAMGEGADDQRIAAAAADEGERSEDEAEEGAEGAEGSENEEMDDDESMMGKSFEMTLETGEVVEAIDGTELVKALMGKVDALGGKLSEGEQTMQKAMTALVETVKGQAELIKSLQGKVATLSSEGRGRKAVVNVAEKPAATMVKSEPTGMTAKDFMAKCETAFNAGRITGRELSVAENALQNGIAVPQDIVQKTLA